MFITFYSVFLPKKLIHEAQKLRQTSTRQLRRWWLGRLDFDVLEQIGAFLRLLDADEEHLRARNVFPGIGQIVEQCLTCPNNALNDRNNLRV